MRRFGKVVRKNGGNFFRLVRDSVVIRSFTGWCVVCFWVLLAIYFFCVIEKILVFLVVNGDYG